MSDGSGAIVDVHVHHRWIVPDDPPWREIEATLAAAKQCGIHKLALLGPVGSLGPDPTPQAIQEGNAHSAAIVKRYADQMVALSYINPAHRPATVRDEIRRGVQEQGMRGIKLWIAVNARDERLNVVMQEAIRYDLPVFFHAWYKTVGWEYHESSPADIRHLALRFPDATIVMLHMPGGRERGVLDIKDLPNVYVDTSGSQPVAGLVEYACRHLGAERILYGSDAPGRDFAPQLAKVIGAHISQADKQKMLGENAQRLLKL